MSHRPSWSSCVFAAALFVSPAAHAVENTVELQVSAAPLLGLVVNRVRAIPPACPEPFSDGSQDWIIDHYSVGEPFLSSESSPTDIVFTEGTVSARRPEIVVPIQASLKTTYCVETAICPLSATLPVTLPLRFVLTADSNQICATYTGVDTDFLGAADPIGTMMTALGPMCAPVSLSAMTGLLGEVTIDDVALAANANGRIGVRMELLTPDGSAGSSLADWDDFMNGALADSGGGEFSIFIDEAMLRRAFGRRMTDGLVCDPAEPEAAACTDELTPTSDASTFWLPDDHAVQVEMDMDVDLGGWCWSDVGLEPVSIEAPFSLGSDGSSLDINAELDWDANDGDIAACVLQNPFFVLTMGLPLQSYVIFQAIADGYSAANEIEGGLPADCSMSGDTQIDCTFPFSLPTLDLGGPVATGVLEATELLAFPSGLSLEGTIDLPVPFEAKQPMTFGAYELPIYGVQGGCSTLHLGYLGFLDIEGGPGEFCPNPYTGEQSPSIVNDPLGIYAVDDVDQGPADTVELRFPWADEEPFWIDPYPAQVQVWSTVGSGTIEIGTPEKTEYGSIGWLAAYINALVQCEPAAGGMPGNPGWFDVEWLVDPPPYEFVAVGTVGWDGSTATLVDLTVNQLSSMTFDARSGVYTLRAANATMTATWSISGTAGAYRYTSTMPLGADLIGMRRADGTYLMVPAAPMTVAFTTPRTGLPRGLTSGVVEAEFVPETFFATGLPLRKR